MAVDPNAETILLEEEEEAKNNNDKTADVSNVNKTAAEASISFNRSRMNNSTHASVSGLWVLKCFSYV